MPMFRLYWPKETPPSVLDGTWWPPFPEAMKSRQASAARASNGRRVWLSQP
jgi:hypothetical protein